jgi:hypothetical protein
MTETYVMENGSTIHWEGAGVYVAISMRGPTTYRKLPDGAKPNSGVLVIDFSSKPPQKRNVTQNHALWTYEN